MSGKDLIFKSKEMTTRKEAAGVLRQIATKLETGSINLVKENENVILSIPENVEMEIEAKSKDKNNLTKKKLEIEIEWKEGEAATGSVKIK